MAPLTHGYEVSKIVKFTEGEMRMAVGRGWVAGETGRCCFTGIQTWLCRMSKF